MSDEQCEQEFTDIITNALRKADRVQCSPEQYRGGLIYMRDEIDMAISASTEMEDLAAEHAEESEDEDAAE